MSNKGCKIFVITDTKLLPLSELLSLYGEVVIFRRPEEFLECSDINEFTHGFIAYSEYDRFNGEALAKQLRRHYDGELHLVDDTIQFNPADSIQQGIINSYILEPVSCGVLDAIFKDEWASMVTDFERMALMI